jgi:undecaprenyl-diphosphatase
MFENLNLYLFSIFNAHAGLAGWRLSASVFAAEWLILLVPVVLMFMWLSGIAVERQAAVRALAAVGAGLAINALIGLLWFHPRPFMAGVGHTFLKHAADSSFPSDHATIMFTVALVLATSRAPGARVFGTWMLPIAAVVAWARVFLGVHFPMDIAGAVAVSLVVTLLSGSRLAVAVDAAILHQLENLYRRMLATLIARGWLRP